MPHSPSMASPILRREELPRHVANLETIAHQQAVAAAQLANMRTQVEQSVRAFLALSRRVGAIEDHIGHAKLQAVNDDPELGPQDAQQLQRLQQRVRRHTLALPDAIDELDRVVHRPAPSALASLKAAHLLSSHGRPRAVSHGQRTATGA